MAYHYENSCSDKVPRLRDRGNIASIRHESHNASESHPLRAASLLTYVVLFGWPIIMLDDTIIKY